MHTLQLAHRTISADDLVPLLSSYQLIPQLLSEMILDRAIAMIECSAAEISEACQQFYQNRNLLDTAQQQEWCACYGLDQATLEQLATRQIRIEKFKQITWRYKNPAYFLQRKCQLEQVVYSLLRTPDRGLANELFFRIQDQEQSFAILARQYSQGPEAQTGGLLGPVELGILHPALAELLYTSPVGVVQPPVSLGNWQMIVRVEALIPARLDDQMEKRLLNEQFESWFKEQLKNLSAHDQVWFGVKPAPEQDAARQLISA